MIRLGGQIKLDNKTSSLGKRLKTKYKIIFSFKDQHGIFEASDTFGRNFDIFHECPGTMRFFPKKYPERYFFKIHAKVLSSRFFPELKISSKT